MQSYYFIARFMIIAMFATQLILLSLQVSALRRHGDRCFKLLSIASAAGAVYTTLCAPAYFLEVTLPTTVFLTTVAMIPGAATLIIGVWGTASLFRSYDQLAKRANNSVARSDP